MAWKAFMRHFNGRKFQIGTQKSKALTDEEHRLSLSLVQWMATATVYTSCLAEKYDRSYRPYFLGQRGAASLNQYFGMQQILPQLENKTAVYVVSPIGLLRRDMTGFPAMLIVISWPTFEATERDRAA